MEGDMLWSLIALEQGAMGRNLHSDANASRAKAPREALACFAAGLSWRGQVWIIIDDKGSENEWKYCYCSSASLCKSGMSVISAEHRFYVCRIRIFLVGTGHNLIFANYGIAQIALKASEHHSCKDITHNIMS